MLLTQSLTSTTAGSFDAGLLAQKQGGRCVVFTTKKKRAREGRFRRTGFADAAGDAELAGFK
jgi:hypothetical protein